MNRWFLPVICLLLSVLLTGCGYKLRGYNSSDVKLNNVYVQNQISDRQLKRDLERIIQSAGGTVATDATQADAVLVLMTRNESQRVVATNASGQAVEYGVLYRLNYSYRVTGNLPILGQALDSGTYPYDPDRPTASGREKSSLLKRLRATVLYDVLNQVDRGLRTQALQPAKEQSSEEAEPSLDQGGASSEGAERGSTN